MASSAQTSSTPQGTLTKMQNSHVSHDTPSTTTSQQLPNIAAFYQIESNTESAGKKITKSKRRIQWRFCIPNLDAIHSGQTEIDNCLEKIEVMVEWSIISGKRRILLNNEMIYMSTDRSTRFEYGWDIDGHDVKIVCQRGSCVKGAMDYDLSVDGLSFISAPNYESLLAHLQKLQAEQLAEELAEGRRQVANYTADGKTFGELDEGFIHRTKFEWKEDGWGGRYHFGEEKEEFIAMNIPRRCSYRKWDDHVKKYEKIILGQSEGYDQSNPPPVEQRGITLRQLWAIEANITRRCVKEGWVNNKEEKLTPDNVTLYDVDKYIIRPYTKSRNLSLVSCLPSTAGEQPPVFFISHWWGEPVRDFIKCLEQVVRDFAINRNEEDERRGGGMTEDTPFWICAHGNNQWSLSSDITMDPRDSGFSRAMEVAEGRTISILDTGGVVFTRIWCSFELFLTLVNDKGKGKEVAKKGRWGVYIVSPHKDRDGVERDAVGIVSGGAPVDEGKSYRTAKREESFPFQLIEQSLDIDVASAEASVAADKVHILNSIRGHTGNRINDNPPTTDDAYEKVNNAIKAAFVSSVPSLRAAWRGNEETWGSFLGYLSRGTAKLSMRFDFREDGWSGIPTDRAAQMIAHLPATTAELIIVNAKFGSEFTDSVTNLVESSSELDYLFISFSEFDGGEEGGKAGGKLADAMARNTSITDLRLYDTDLMTGNNVERWEAALIKNTKLEELELDGVKRDIVKRLKKATKHRTPKLKIY